MKFLRRRRRDDGEFSVVVDVGSAAPSDELLYNTMYKNVHMRIMRNLTDLLACLPFLFVMDRGPRKMMGTRKSPPERRRRRHLSCQHLKFSLSLFFFSV